MKVQEIKTETDEPTIDELYCDLDGVLVNFDKFAEEVVGISAKDWDQDKKLKGRFWGKVGKMAKDGKQVFGAMEPMPDAHKLWAFIQRYDPIILSATGHLHTAEHEKRDWVRRHLGDRAADRAIFVFSAAEKAKYATPRSILIDDRAKAIHPWRAARGIGVHHVSADDSIEQLKALGL